jgi:hypothetical protein
VTFPETEYGVGLPTCRTDGQRLKRPKLVYIADRIGRRGLKATHWSLANLEVPSPIDGSGVKEGHS